MGESDFLESTVSLETNTIYTDSTYILGAISVLHNESKVLARSERLKTVDGNLVAGLDLIVVGGVDKGQRKHALLLQVGLVDTGEGASNDSKTTEETGLESSVFTGGTFTVVVVTDDNPLDTVVAVVSSGLGDTSELASDLVLDLVSLAVLSVDGTNQTVFYAWPGQSDPEEMHTAARTGDVLEVTAVFEPGTASRDVVSRWNNMSTHASIH